ncbi:acyl-CoA dehydrogenase family protein [Streptomyces sp. NBC_01187]|uniref:acyl-CoA dehydrogenase family protein n=1 Tax=Streptomyces sp. NBC_01187 TaxID=2903766 RepID=UPI0038654AE8|nr:acyl-CoA/acyl-ACP dehydrogenase [Streptomyces sp. NBC_01187]
MDFTPTEAQAAARELAAEIFEDLSTPERLRALDGDTDAELWKGLCAAGLVAAVEETGLLGLALMLEEQGRRTAQVPFAATCVYGLLPIGAYGTSEQRARWLPALRVGTAVATGAFPPPGRGPAVTASPAVRGPSRDAAAVTSAGAGEDDQEGEGGGGDWRLSGVVPVVPWLREATHVLVPARCATDGVVRCFLVETARTGVRVVPVETTAPWSAGRLALEDVSGEVLGEGAPSGPHVPHSSYDEAYRPTLDRARTGFAALQAGVCAGSLARAVEHTCEREQFGRPLSTHQGVQLRAADAHMDTEAIRVTVYEAAWRHDQGLPAHTHSLTAAWWAADAGRRVVHAGQHLHGGIGADLDHPVHRHFLWGRQLDACLGSPGALLAELGEALAAPEEEVPSVLKEGVPSVPPEDAGRSVAPEDL